MHITCVRSPQELESLRGDWDRLAGNMPFRSWAWNATWWRHYGAGDELFVLAARDAAGSLVGIAPWYLQRSWIRGWVVQFLGSGEVCTDYRSLLCIPGSEQHVAQAIGAWLLAAGECNQPRNGSDAHRAWDVLSFGNIEAADVAMNSLLRELDAHCSLVRIEPDINCWRLELPGSWEAYLAQLSKSHRKQLRRLENRVLAAGRARLHTITQPEELDRGLAVLIDLHQRRWRACGQPGVFGAPRFRAFHRDVARQFLESGQLRLHWLELDGQPAAAEYDFAGDGVIYSYQSGVDPARRAEEPGRLITIAVIQAALAEGCRAIDFLRGDEPYKAHWRAEPRACLRAEIVAPTWSARVRDEAFVRARAARRWWRNRWHGTVHAPREPRVEYASGAADEVPRQRPPDDRPTTLDHGHPRRSEESRPQSRDPDQAFEVVPQDSAR